MNRRTLIASAAAPSLLWAAAPAITPAFTQVRIDGKVVPYRDALAKRNIILSDGWGVDWVALTTEDQQLLPILPTDAARFFLLDKRNLNKSVRLTVRRHAFTPGLEVLEVRRLVDGAEWDTYYWCEICAIKSFHLHTCDCCQGPIELREHPLGKPFTFRVVE